MFVCPVRLLLGRGLKIESYSIDGNNVWFGLISIESQRSYEFRFSVSSRDLGSEFPRAGSTKGFDSQSRECQALVPDLH